MKRPDGELIAEYVTESHHGCEDGQLTYHEFVATPARYTGRLRFRFPDGKMTPWYTPSRVPGWLRALWREAMEAEEQS